MSYDLMVFDPASAPTGRIAFLDWFRQQTKWTESHGYNDPSVPTAELCVASRNDRNFSANEWTVGK